MNQVYLINSASFAPYQDISANVKPARLNSFIKKAQDLDLRLLLGDALYYDLLKNCNADGTLKSGSPASYDGLLNGLEYTDGQGFMIIYDGITPALVYYTLARFVENDNIRYTANGPVLKNGDESTILNYADTIRIAQQYRSIANAYANNIEKYLVNHKADFPAWHLSELSKSSRQPGARIRAVDRTDFNYPAPDTFFNLNNYTDGY